MRINHLQNQKLAHAARAGFSMIEILAVVGIIAILAVITLAGYSKLVGVGARSNATRMTIMKVDNIIHQKLDEIGRIANKLDSSDKDFKLLKAKLLNSNTAADDQTVIIFAKKQLMKEFLPQRWEDLVGLDGYAGASTSNGTDPKFLGQGTNDDSSLGKVLGESIRSGSGIDMTKHDRATESAELLYLICSRGSSLGNATVDAAEFIQSEIGDTDGDGLLEVLDSWGKPLRYYRWPTRLYRPGGMKSTYDDSPVAADLDTIDENKILLNVTKSNIDTTTLNRDPQDDLNRVQSYLAGLDAMNTNDAAILSRICGTTSTTNRYHGFERKYHTLQTYFTPLIISAGPDGELGLYEPYQNDNGNNNDPADDQLGTLAQPLPAVKSNPGTSVLADSVTNLKLQ